MSDPSREEAALAGHRLEQAEGAVEDHVTADEAVPPAQPGLVRADPPPLSALLAAAAVGLLTLVVLVLVGLRIAGTA